MKIKRLILLLITLGLMAGLAVLQLNGKSQQGKIEVFSAGNDEISVTVDFDKIISNGSPLVFGGVHSPDITHLSMWDEIQSSGVTSLRSDLFLEFCAPRDITINDYKSNKNNIQDPTNWTQSCLENLNSTYSMASERGMKVTAIVAYTPPWLTKNGTSREMPVDWEIYNDIVGKIYRLNRHNIDFIEVWNEPDHPTFFKSTGSIKDAEDAYIQLYENVSNTLRNIDNEINDGKRVSIGGPAISKPQSISFVKRLLENQKDKANLDFVSIHLYDGGDIHISQVRKMMIDSGFGHLPLYVSEWNYGSTAKIGREYNQTYKAVPYSAERLINFLNNNVAMASYFSLRENIPNHSLPERQSYGIYQKINNRHEPFPQINVWKLLSTELKLGNGDSKIVSVSSSENIPVLGFVNVYGESGVVIVNKNAKQTVDLTTKNFGRTHFPIDIQLSKITPSGLELAFCNERIFPQKTSVSFKFEAPANSVVAVKLIPNQVSLKNLVKILATTTQADCLIIEDNN